MPLDLSRWSRQEIFDRVVRGLASQGWQQSIDGGGCCVYKDQSGRRCAAGWLIPKGHILENTFLSWTRLVEAGRITNGHRVLIENLQSIHDHHGHRMQTAMAKYAEREGLKWPEGVE